MKFLQKRIIFADIGFPSLGRASIDAVLQDFDNGGNVASRIL